MKKHYELVYIIPVKTDEYDPQPVIDMVNAAIKEFEGDVVRTEDWGKRKLAYQIKHFSYGHYVLNVIDFTPEKVTEFDAKLKTMHELLRYQIISVKSTEPIKKAQETEQENEEHKAKKEKAEKKDDKPAKKKEKSEVKKKASMEDLDKKIDEILNV